MDMRVNAPAWSAAGPEVEHEPRIVDDEAAEPGRAEAHPCQENFDPRQQIPVHASTRFTPFLLCSILRDQCCRKSL